MSNIQLRPPTRKYWFETWAGTNYVECYLRWDQHFNRPPSTLTDSMGGGLEVMTRRWELKWSATMQRLIVSVWFLMVWIDLPKFKRRK
jgi:hypothetical protein